MASLNQAVQLDTLRMQQQMQLGQPPQPKVDLDSAIEQVLLDGGWTDIDQITKSPDLQQNAQQINPMNSGNPGNISTALQAIAFGGK